MEYKNLNKGVFKPFHDSGLGITRDKIFYYYRTILLLTVALTLKGIVFFLLLIKYFFNTFSIVIKKKTFPLFKSENHFKTKTN